MKEEQAKTTTKATNNHHRRNTILKWTGIAIVLIAIIVASIGTWLFVDSTKAINQYVDDVNNQYADIRDDKNVDKPNVTLRQVTLGAAINGKYRRMRDLDANYQKLINRLRNYTLTIGVHNQMVAKFNAGIQGNEVLSSDILNLTNQMTDLVKKNYPNQTDEINALQELGQKITENTKFTDISSTVSTVLHSNDKWLNTEREAIESARQQFQNKINSI